MLYPSQVFVGNLPFKLNEDELKAEFANVGVVTSANIIRHGVHRSRGYGFVEFDTMEEAQKAVDSMHNAELKGRKINVEIAKPKPEPAEGAGEGGESKPPRSGRRGGRGGRGGAARSGRARRTADDKPAVKAMENALFVANLPFTVTDDSLFAIFKDNNPKTARIITRGARSRGYGFVEFSSPDDSKAALEKTYEVEGRQLTVKVANELPAEEKTDDAEAAATTTTTTTTTATDSSAAEASSETKEEAKTEAKEEAKKEEADEAKE